MSGNETNPISLHCACNSSEEERLTDLLEEFWRAEEVGVKNSSTGPEVECEKFYSETTRRDSTGRYVVRLPWRNPEILDKVIIGDSFAHAIRALKRLESNFEKDEKLKFEYTKFMKEYLELGHISLVPGQQPSKNSDYFFLPHHGVWREESSTTKLRTVFNGSSRLSSGQSLNDLLHSGANLLRNQIDLICSWRNYRVALSSDIDKMFRQFNVDEKDRKFQAILWRFSQQEPIQIFVLNTVTYGLTCSPFLALRSLLQLAQDYESVSPLEAEVLRKEMYSDNILTGAHTLLEAISKVEKLIELFQKAQIKLRKWASNEPEAKALPKDMLVLEEVSLFTPDASVPILGIGWNPTDDCFKIQVRSLPVAEPYTKCNVLSRIARTFDPLGWIAPVIIQAKILMQSLWLIKVGWDDELPSDVALKWSKWVEQIPLIDKIKIPRWSGYTPDTEIIEIHGFADASKSAYGAVVYLRLMKEKSVNVVLQVAKTRVAPIKTLSIPRLELCASVLLSRLVKNYLDSTQIKIQSTHLWTDSADVLFWLRDHPSRWGVFVATRCSEIHTNVPDAFWHHVRSKDNPADVLSRGIDPSKLDECVLWGKGPKFLTERDNSWPRVLDELDQFYDLQ